MLMSSPGNKLGLETKRLDHPDVVNLMGRHATYMIRSFVHGNSLKIPSLKKWIKQNTRWSLLCGLEESLEASFQRNLCSSLDLGNTLNSYEFLQMKSLVIPWSCGPLLMPNSRPFIPSFKRKESLL